MKKKRRRRVPRIPLPRQTGGTHRSKKGKGSYRRKKQKNGPNRDRSLILRVVVFDGGSDIVYNGKD